VNISKFNFIQDLEKVYEKNPAYCSNCNKVLTFKKFYNQLDNPNKYCSKKCKESLLSNNLIVENYNDFSSETEKIIYTYLAFNYPYYIIHHNIKDIFPPYEIDICIETENYPIYIEFNSQLHYSTSIKGEKHQLNDIIKKQLICDKNQNKLIRLWSKGGLYSKPIIFSNALNLMKQELNYLINAKNTYGQCIDIVVDKNGEIFRYNEKFKHLNIDNIKLNN
jgi:hypothetical protein